jgi:hypothetical protein
MTEEQLKKAAILYCERSGFDPYETKKDPSTGQDVMRLDMAIRMVASHLVITACIQDVVMGELQ